MAHSINVVQSNINSIRQTCGTYLTVLGVRDQREQLRKHRSFCNLCMGSYIIRRMLDAETRVQGAEYRTRVARRNLSRLRSAIR